MKWSWFQQEPSLTLAETQDTEGRANTDLFTTDFNSVHQNTKYSSLAYPNNSAQPKRESRRASVQYYNKQLQKHLSFLMAKIKKLTIYFKEVSMTP